MQQGQIIQLLTIAHTDNNDSKRSRAFEQLSRLSQTAGFFPFLLREIVTKPSIGLAIRQSALLFLKNHIIRRWKGPSRGGESRREHKELSEEEKSKIRRDLMDILAQGEEISTKLNVQVAVSIGSICKWDFPEQWPDIIKQLARLAATSSKPRAIFYALKTLIVISTSLSSAKAKATFFQQSPQLLSALSPILLRSYDKFCNTVQSILHHHHSSSSSSSSLSSSRSDLSSSSELSSLSSPSSSDDSSSFSSSNSELTSGGTIPERAKTILQVSFEIINTAYKLFFSILKERLIEIPNGNPKHPAHQWLTRLREIIQPLHHLAREITPFPSLHDLTLRRVEKLLNHSAKIAYIMHENYVEAFTPHLKPFIVRSFEWLTAMPSSVCPQYTITTMTFFHGCLGRIAELSLLPQPVVAKLASTLVTQYFAISREDLRTWKEEPEQFVQIEMYGWQESTRLCAQVLFSGLCNQYEKWLAVVAQRLFDHLSTVQPTNLKSLLHRDAALTAIGLAVSPSLLAHLPMGTMIQVLEEETKRKGPPELAVLHRRVAFVIDEWFRASSVARLCSREETATIFRILLALFRHPDLCVNIWAAIALRGCIDQYEFDSTCLLPLVPDFIPLITSLAFRLQHDLIHTHLLSILALIISQLQEDIKPYLNQILDCLQRLWSDAEENYILKTTIIQIFVVIARIPTLHSPRVRAFMLSVVSHCVDISIPDAAHYIEDGIGLWLEVVAASKVLERSLIDCWRFLPLILEESFEQLNELMTITALYITIDPQQFIATYGTAPAQMCSKLLGQVHIRGIPLILVVPHAYIQMAEHPRNLVPLSPLFKQLFRLLQDQETRKKLAVPISLVFARFLYRHGPEALAGFLRSLEQGEVPQLARSLVQIWLQALTNPTPPTIADALLLWAALCRSLTGELFLSGLSSSAISSYLVPLIDCLISFPSLDPDSCSNTGCLHHAFVAPLLNVDRKQKLCDAVRLLVQILPSPPSHFLKPEHLHLIN
jgi:hypothetical protein